MTAKQISKIANIFGKQASKQATANITIVGCWQLNGWKDLHGITMKPHWKEFWTFVSSEDTDSEGLYVCDHIKLHSSVGNWSVKNDVLQLIRKEMVCRYTIIELSATNLILELPIWEHNSEVFYFERI